MLTIRSYAAPISEPRLRGSAGTGGGKVFKLTPSGSGYNESVLHSLGHAGPQGGLILDKEGALYGTVSSSGRQDGDGYVFKVTP